ncbi:hypothetical protein [Streptomyces roseoverticillatus]|uniref:hypothetical protein n=1 Tax=Streptomyces roseoverticillatus TaxID=66429 RepID=UPI001B80D7C1|nr:hypothetical protein [Streptomyces roseoverticillatus]
MRDPIQKGITLRRYALVGREIRLSDDAPVPVPGPGEVLVRVAACTVRKHSERAPYAGPPPEVLEVAVRP